MWPMSKKRKTNRSKSSLGEKTPARAPAAVSSPREERRSRPLARSAWIVGAAALFAIATAAGVFWALHGQTPATPAPVATAHYSGGTECASCHAKEHVAWKGSDHDLAMRIADEKSVLGNFGDAKFTYAGTTSTFSRRDGKFFVNTDGPDGKLADYEIKYTFGVHPLQQYLIEFP